jgi:hypothetical protein
MNTVDYYREETVRLRANIEALRVYAEGKEADVSVDSSFRNGLAAAYGDIARKLAVASHGDFENVRKT